MTDTKRSREFWICSNGELEEAAFRQENHAEDECKLYDFKEIIHVREVTPIDWAKVWAKANIGVLELSERLLIQNAVERSLRGEL